MAVPKAARAARSKPRKPIAPSPATDDYGRLLPLRHVQQILMCSRQKIYKLYEAGSLQLVKFGAQTRVTDSSLRALMSGSGLPPAVLKRRYSAKPKA
jgi:hypothetical protein